MSNSSLNQKGVSLYYQVEMHIRSKIESGEWQAGYKLPTEPQLCEYFDVSRTTVRQAVESLVENGFLTKKQGSGTYVALPTFSRNRLTTQPSDSVCRYIYTPILQTDLLYSFKNMLLVQVSHIMMLEKQNLVSFEDAKKALGFIMPLFEKAPETIGINPLNEDIYLNFEQYCIAHLGIENAGLFSIAKSRNDMIPTVTRMNARDLLLPICELLLKFLLEIQTLAKNNRDKLLGIYTHTMLSQPATLEFYFLSVAFGLERNLSQLLNLYPTLNCCPLGACGCTGTSYPIDRDYTAKLLGFDDLVLNALDAVASRDFLLDIIAAFSSVGSSIGRLAQDLYLWSTDEFHYVRFTDAYSCGSSLMPQKRNALALEHIKGKTSHLASAYMDVFTILKGTGYSHCRDLLECTPVLYEAAKQTLAILTLSKDLLSQTEFLYDQMQVRLADGNSLATDIADYLSQTEKIPFRSAHNIVSSALKEKRPTDKNVLTLKDLNNSCKHHTGKITSITEADFARLFTPESSISRKASEGSPSTEHCMNMHRILNEKLIDDEHKLQSIQSNLDKATRLREQELSHFLL